MFNKVTPEAVGVSSGKLLDFLGMLDEYGFSVHSVMMARGEDIFLECYYAPFDKDYKHRMYSVSKSFITLAVGLAAWEGLISLDEPIMKYFPEYRNENTTARFDEATVRDMLTMRSPMVDYGAWFGGEDRVAAYFTQGSRQIPGTNFGYDSAGSFLVCAAVERVTGKPYMEYIKEKVLLDMGFSPDAYCLVAPGGHSHSDSGVMCTPRDLLIYARLLMRGGEWGGKQYLSRDFVKEAISRQTDNNLGDGLALYKNHGYGYLIWKMPRDGFAFVGAGTQLVICDPKSDFTFVITGENLYVEETVRSVIIHELYRYIIPTLGAPIPEDGAAYSALSGYVSGAKLISLSGGTADNIAARINGKRYILEENQNGFKYLRFEFDGEGGSLEYEDGEGVKRLPFGIGRNVICDFPDKKRMDIVAGKYVDGHYRAAVSATWCEGAKLHILAQVIDDYLGKVHIVAAFKDERVSVSMVHHGQYILKNYQGKLVGRIEN